MLKLEILGIPQPKQSARFSIVKGRIMSYQKKSVKDNEANIGYTVMRQLPSGFVPYDCPVFAHIEYVFPIPSSFSKKLKQSITDGKRVYKDTKPDLTDNLNKGLIDALAGIVYINDSRIVSIVASKYYGTTPKTIIQFKPEER
jgi:Holliday junction resolvase RusA-like endonuclease